MNHLLNHHTQGYADNNVPRDPAYTIPDVIHKAPTVRKLQVLNIGARVTGIMNAYHFQEQAKNVDFVVYEKNHDIGGTWLGNRYPGSAPIHRTLSLSLRLTRNTLCK